MHTAHEVQVWNHRGSRRTRWFACEVIGRRPASRSFVAAGLTNDWYDVRLADGSAYECCNPECVRAKGRG
jgi:hypothetical protein